MRIARSLLFATSALGGVLISTAALAQDNAQADQGISEVVVTATRQTDTVGRVPLSIAAVTQQNLDEQGIKTAADLVRVVPGLNVVGNPGSVQQTFSIRGVVGATGAATVGVYLNDTNLTKRANGGVAQNNGVIAPLLYDLERVEVLKGPQGTLYGGSSEGGTVRYITPSPSLTKFSGSARAEVADYTGHGELSHELAAAVGGPIINDKIGFRISGIRRNTGGYIDVRSGLDNHMIRENANSQKDWAARAALLFQLNDRGSAELSWYHTESKNEGGPNSSTAIFLPGGVRAPASQTFTTPQVCVTQNGTRPSTLANPVGQPGGPAASAYVPQNVVCQGAPVAGTVYVRPSLTYGPYTTNDHTNIATGLQGVLGSAAAEDVAALTLNYDFEHMNVKSITSYIHDQGNSNTPGGEEWAGPTTVNPPNGVTGQFTTLDLTHRGFPLFALFPQTQEGTFIAGNKRHGIEEELRFSSVGASRLTWVAGLYFSAEQTHIHYYYKTDPAVADRALGLFYGPTYTSFSRYGVVNDRGFQADLEAVIKDVELAGFAEANFWIIPDKLRATAGVRLSRVENEYYQTNYGQFSGRMLSSIGSVTQGKSVNSPVTPKFGLQYQINPTNMIYATASKGFRAGGVNAQISQTICKTFLDQLGITADQVPPAYDPDTVWSYEAGAKLRLLDNKLSFNFAGYRIDWSDVQTTITLGCGQGFTEKGGRARSQGVDLQAQYRPIRPLTLTAAVGYTNAKYLDAIAGPLGPIAGQRPSFNAGDHLNVPPIQVSLSAQYDFSLMGRWDSYIRFDYQYQNQYRFGPTFGTASFTALGGPGGGMVRAQDLLNARAGVRVNGWEVNAFVQNLLNSRDYVASSGLADGRVTCSAASGDCSTFTAYNPFVLQTFQRPRTVGIQANYRF